MEISTPSSRSFLTRLLSSPSLLGDLTLTSSNPLRDMQAHQRQFLLTLHVSFPNELLPALDLLDRGLVIRFEVAESSPTKTNVDQSDVESMEPNLDATSRGPLAVYYVQSAQTRPRSRSGPSRRFLDPTPTHYEV